MLKALSKGIRTIGGRIREQGVRTTALWAYARGIPKATGVPLLQYSRVTESLYVGPQHRAGGKRALIHAGITHIVNMRSEFDDAAHGLTLDDARPSHPLQDAQDKKYCYLPTPDDEPISPEHIANGITFIDGAIRGGGVVYIHCSAGVGRAPSMAAAYLISTGWGVEDALALIRKARPFIRPTATQICALKQFAAQAKVFSTGAGNTPHPNLPPQGGKGRHS